MCTSGCGDFTASWLIYPCRVARSTGVLFHSSVPSKSIVRSMTSGGGGGGWVGGGGGGWFGGGGSGLSIFTACVMLGIVMMKMIRSTNMTSINGVMLMSEYD